MYNNFTTLAATFEKVAELYRSSTFAAHNRQSCTSGARNMLKYQIEALG